MSCVIMTDNCNKGLCDIFPTSPCMGVSFKEIGCHRVDMVQLQLFSFKEPSAVPSSYGFLVSLSDRCSCYLNEIDIKIFIKLVIL